MIVQKLSVVPTLSELLLGVYHMQGTREDSKEVYERDPVLVMKRNIVREQQAVKLYVDVLGSPKLRKNSLA